MSTTNTLHDQIRRERWMLRGCLACFVVIGFAIGWRIAGRQAASHPKPETKMALPTNSGVPLGEEDILTGYFEDAAARIQRIILHPGTTAFSRSRNSQLMQEVEQIRQQLGVQTGLWIGDNMPKAYRLGLADGDKQAVAVAQTDAATGTMMRKAFNVIDQDALKVLAKDSAGSLIKAANGMAYRANSILRQTAQMGLSEDKINKILAGGIIEGQPRNTITALRDELIKVHGETVPAGSMNFEAGYYAQMVVRTKTREAVIEGRHNRFREVGIDLVRIIGRDTIHFCTEFLNHVYSLSGDSEDYPSYDELPDGGPPFHPFCSKSTVAFVPALASKAQIRDSYTDDDGMKFLGTDAAKAQRMFRDTQRYQELAGRKARA